MRFDTGIVSPCHYVLSCGRMQLTEEQTSNILQRLEAGESGASIARDLGIAKQRVSDIRRKHMASLSPAKDAAPVDMDDDDDKSEAGRMRATLSKLLPPEERARLMVKLVKDDDVSPSTRARLIERIDSLCGVHEAPPERESTKPLFDIDGLPADLSFTKSTSSQS